MNHSAEFQRALSHLGERGYRINDRGHNVIVQREGNKLILALRLEGYLIEVREPGEQEVRSVSAIDLVELVERRLGRSPAP